MPARSPSLRLVAAFALLIGCGEDAPGLRPAADGPGADRPVPATRAPLAEQLVSEEGVAGLRLGGLPSPAKDLSPHGLQDARRQPKTGPFHAGRLFPSVRLVPSGHGRFHDYTELCAYSEDGVVLALAVGREPRARDEWPVRGRLPDWEGRDLRLFRIAEGPRGVTYQVVDAQGYAVGLLACAGAPDPDLFREGLVWQVRYERAAPPPRPPADPAAFDRLLADGDAVGAARVLAQLPLDRPREEALLARGGLGAYALHASARARGLPPATAPELAGDTQRIVWNFWQEQWRLVAALQARKLQALDWEVHFAMLQAGLPVYAAPDVRISRLSGKELRLDADHQAQVDEVAREAARALFEAAGPARYDALLAGLLRRTTWDLAARERLFYASLPPGAHPAADARGALRAQLADELRRAWRRGGRTKLDALGRYLAAVAECFSDPEAREADRRAVLLRLAETPDQYANWVVRVRGAPPAAGQSDPELLDWLPEPSRAEILARLAELAGSARAIPAAAAANEYLLDFDRNPDLAAWWRFANVRDGVDAPRFEAAVRGRAGLLRYYAAIDRADAGGERDAAKVLELERAACAAYAAHYGPEATALFLCLDPEHDLGRPARDALPAQWHGLVLEAQRVRAHVRPSLDAGGSAHAGLVRFLELAARYRADPTRAKNPLVRLLQDRHMRSFASAILGQHREEAYVHVFLPGAQAGLEDLELLNRWCNHGVASKALVDHYARSATLVLRRDTGPLDVRGVTLVGPGKRGEWLGDRLAIEPSGADVGGGYSYEVLLPGGAARGEFQLDRAEPGDRRHRILTLTISGP